MRHGDKSSVNAMFLVAGSALATWASANFQLNLTLQAVGTRPQLLFFANLDLSTHYLAGSPMAKILEVKYDHLADARVCEVAHESLADLCWYEVAYATQAQGDAAWFFVAYERQATCKIFKVKHASQADLKLFRVMQPEQAGWRNDGHLLNGKIG